MRQLALVLKWEGRLSNLRLREILGLAHTRASVTISQFNKRYPRWLDWNAVDRCHYPTPEFYRELQEEDRSHRADSLASYLTLIGLPHAMSVDVDQAVVLAAFPELVAPDARIFALLAQAAGLQQTVRITYRSMNEPTPHERIIAPHSIVRAGRRWHVRAYSPLNEQFRDYALGRISEATLLDIPAEKRRRDDEAWMAEVPVRLMAHPKLSYEQGMVIRDEYFNGNAAHTAICRGALVSYFIQDIRAATDPATQLPPEYQLVVENIKEIRKNNPWIFLK